MIELELISTSYSNYIEVRLDEKVERFIASLHGSIVASQIGANPTFKYVNVYASTQSKSWNQQLFQLYSDAIRIFERVYQDHNVTKELAGCIESVLKHIDYEQLRKWVIFQSGIVIPNNFKTEFEEDIDNNITRDKTFLKDDMYSLCTLTIILKFLLPIIVYFLAINKKRLGSPSKELYVLNKLLSVTSFIELPPYIKLDEYVNAIVKNNAEKDNKILILKGISTDDYVSWLLANILLTKLPFVDLDDKKNNPIIIVFRSIMQKTANGYNSLTNKVKEKSLDIHSQDTDSNKISVLEKYKAKSLFSIGEIVELEYTLHNYAYVAQRLSTRIDHNSLENSIAIANKFIDKPISEYQILIVKWIVKSMCSPYAIEYFTKQTLVKLLAIAHELLYANGHKYIALWLLSECLDSEDSETMYVTTIDTKQRLSQAIIDEILTLYPFQRETNKVKEDIKKHAVFKVIDDIINEIKIKGWFMHADESRIVEVFGSTSRMFTITPDIKSYLGRLVCDIGKRALV